MIIDFHNHYYPPEYLDAVKAGRSGIKIDYDSDGNPRLHYPGDYNILVPGHRDLDYREKVLADLGVDLQVATFTTPGVHMETPELAVELARRINDAYAGERKRRKAFTFLATLPLNDPAASVAELERAMGLGLPGAMVFSNVNGVALADARYEPLWRKADELNAVIYIHPAHPLGVEAMEQYWLMPLVGFLMDTTLAAAHLVFAGVPRRYPRITWVLCHMGGAVPYLAERFDRGYEAFSECRQHIDQPPSAYLKQFYYDTVNFDLNCIELAISFAGVDHILAGSDYPHQIGSIPKMLQALKGLDVTEGDRRKMMGENAARILAL
ncbi:MAG TPA: amidohydrolase family protein [Vicinamibacterales bacterium]|jgi:aminocarboxymuconate-semialdehyde decarboxylase|nr:amidohydrolase family protein [Vicinamibacterales bacterium]